MNTDCPNCGKWIEAATEAARERNAMKDKLVACQGRNDKMREAFHRITELTIQNTVMRVAIDALTAYSEPHTKP